MANAKIISNICGGITKSNVAKIGLGESINMYPEIQQNDSSCQIAMRTICGMVKSLDIQGNCRGIYRVSRGYDNKPVLYTVYDQTLYLIDENHTIEEIGTIESVGTECHMCETGGYGSAHPHLIITDGTNVYAVNTGLSIGDQQLDLKKLELPLRVNSKTQYIRPTHCAYLYGYLIVNDAGTDAFYTSYQYPFETEDSQTPQFYEERKNFINWWITLPDNIKQEYIAGTRQDLQYKRYEKFIKGTADDTPEKDDVFQVWTVQYARYGFITYSEWCPDNTIALISNGSKLYTFGERSWQVFSYNDDKNNPFSSPDNAAGNIGIKAPDSLAILSTTAIFLGSSDVGENGIFMISDTNLKRISTQDIERELSQIKNPQNAYSSIWQEHQHVFYSITFEDSQKTFVYDVSENAWHYRSSYDEVNHLTFWRYNHATFAYGKIFFGTKNALVYMDENKYTEHDGRCMLKLRRGAVLTSNDQPFYIDEMKLIANQGQHSFNDQYDNMELNPRVSFRYSWDGATWSDYEDAYLGKIGMYEYDTSLFGLGFGSFFTIEISTTENIPFSIQNVLINWTPTSMMRY